MKKVSLRQAKAHFSRYIEAAEKGQETVIARAGKAVARIVPLSSFTQVRKLGLLNGKGRIPDDFNAPFPDSVLAGFSGNRK